MFTFFTDWCSNVPAILMFRRNLYARGWVYFSKIKIRREFFLQDLYTKQDLIRTIETEKDGTRPNETKQDQTRPNETKQDQKKLTKPNKTKWDQMKPKETKWDYRLFFYQTQALACAYFFHSSM